MSMSAVALVVASDMLSYSYPIVINPIVYVLCG